MEEKRTPLTPGQTRSRVVINPGELVLFFALLFGIALSRLYNYVLFHSLAELYSIVIAFSFFLIAWNAREIMENKAFLFLGIAYFFVALIDLIHTLAYKGMGVFPGYSANLPTQLWIGARFLESLSLVLAPIFSRRSFNSSIIILLYSLYCVLLLGSIFLQYFPTCYVEGSGLTAFKIYSEYVICFLLLSSIILFFLRRKNFPEETFLLLELSILVTIFSEISFTQYLGVYDLANMLGHLLKIVSFYLIYLAVIHSGLKKPFDFLFFSLKKSEEKYRNLVEHLNDGLALVNPDLTFTYANPKAEKVFGVLSGQLAGRTLREFLPEEEKQKVEQELEKRKLGLQSNYELTIKRPNGEKRIIQVSANPVYDDKGIFAGTSAIFQDITLQKIQEREIEKLARVFEESSEAIIILDSQGSIKRLNKKAEQLLGSSEELKEKKGFPDLVFPQDQEVAQEKLKQVLSGERNPGFEARIRTSKGETLPSWISLFPVFYSDSEPQEIVAIIVDLSERKKAEELHADFIRSIIHDMANPILAVQSALEILESKGDCPPSGKEYLDMAHLNIKKIGNLLGNFSRALNYPRFDSDFPKKPYFLEEILHRLMEEQMPLFNSKGVDLALRKLSGGVKVLANENLERAFSNILDNALKFTPPKGMVEVTLKKEEGKALISIRDTGPGISQDDLPNIFKRFYKGKGSQAGTGLGLYTAKLIVEELGGEITVESAKGKGSEFTISLPIFEG